MSERVFQSSKLYDGYSACFRQWKAEGTHCRFLHGYAISFRVDFEGALDYRNWVWDFGAAKRSNYKVPAQYYDSHLPEMGIKEYFDWLLDHTTIVATDDPELKEFELLDYKGVIQLRTMPNVGCEQFAKHIYFVLNDWVQFESNGRVKVKRVEVFEHNKNSASYGER